MISFYQIPSYISSLQVGGGGHIQFKIFSKKKTAEDFEALGLRGEVRLVLPRSAKAYFLLHHFDSGLGDECSNIGAAIWG